MEDKILDFEQKVKNLNYFEAQKYLIENNHWEEIKWQDSYSIRQYACYLKEREKIINEKKRK